MRYLTLAEALAVGQAVTGIDAQVLAKASRLELLDSALAAPQAGFGETEFYPSLVDKAAVLMSRIVRNHPLPDGNKRLAWTCTVLFCRLNGLDLAATTDDAVAFVRSLAAGEHDEEDAAPWIRQRLTER